MPIATRPLLLLPLLVALVGCPHRTIPGAPPHRDPAPLPTVPDSSPVVADEEDPALSPLTSDEVVRLAFQRNHGWRSQQRSLDQARFALDAAQAAHFAPRLNASYTLGQGDDSGSGRIALSTRIWGFQLEPYLRFGFAGRGSDTAADHERDAFTSAAGFTLTRQLFAIAEHIRLRQGLTGAERALYKAANAAAMAGRRLELEARQRFFAVQRADSRVAQRERRVAEAADFLALVRDNVRLGFKAPIEALNAEIDLNQAEADLIGERTAALSAREDLNQFLGRPLTAPIAIIPVEVTTDPPPLPDLSGDLLRLLSSHEDVGNQARDLDALIDEIRVARDQLLPQVQAALSAESAATGPDWFDARDGYERSIALTLSYSVPLDGLRSERARLGQLDRQLQDALQRSEDVRTDLERRLRGQHRRLDQLGRQLALAKARAEAENLRNQATERRWQAGAVDNLELTRAKGALDNARLALTDTRIELVLAHAEYRALLPVALRPGAGD